jgi:membrane-bound ClpP family serine protease
VVVPAERQADKVVAITIEGPIDATTALSVRRRIALAEKGGANAIVIEINSPGGELGAVLEITNAIKASAISNTVAWVNPDAYSGGAIVALACREIVSSSPASMGDAFIVTQTVVQGQNRMGLRGLTPDERTKLLPVLLADVTDSARRAGWDEYKAIVEAAAAYAHTEMQAKYDARNPAALKQLVGAGTKLRPFPNDVMAAAFKSAMSIYEELNTKNESWKKIYADYSKFRADQNLWFRFTEATFDRFMQSQKL